MDTKKMSNNTFKSKNILFICNLFVIFGSFNICFAKKTKIAFFINFLTVRGVEVAVYDYADCNETILGNESIIINNAEIFNDPKSGFHNDYTNSAREKFVKRFGNRFFDCANMKEADEIMKRENVDIFYTQKYGVIDDKVSKVCKNAIHAVFTVQAHGDAYACISEWLSKAYSSHHAPYVPYMVRVDDTHETLHDELKIPRGTVIFGRHGGSGTFSIPYAREAVQEIAKKHKDWYFLFLNTNKFCDLPNVIFLPATADMVYKAKFINTCDAMIHAREEGETFGLACGEFSMKNKPVITCSNMGDRCHIEILGNKGFYYNNKQELLNIFESIANNIDKIRNQDWDCYSKKYNPEIVMKKFDEIFIQPLIK